MAVSEQKRSFFTYGKMTWTALAVMEAFVVVAFFVGWYFSNILFAGLILFQGALFAFWWRGRRRWDAKGGEAQIVQYFKSLGDKHRD